MNHEITRTNTNQADYFYFVLFRVISWLLRLPVITIPLAPRVAVTARINYNSQRIIEALPKSSLDVKF